MPRTIPDEEWQRVQARMQIADFAEDLFNDPQLNKEAKALIKRKHPNMQIPDYDIEQRLEQRLAADRKERDDREREQQERTQKQNFDALRKKTQDDYGFTNEAMEELEKLMLEKNVGDYEVAAQYMASKSPKPSDATAFSDGLWNIDKAPGFADIAKDPEGWGRSEILKTLYATAGS